MRRTLFVVCLSLFVSQAARAQVVADSITIGKVRVSSDTGVVRVPVYLRDVAGTPIGWDRGPHKHIDQIAFGVGYGPRECVDAVAPFFDRSQGVLAGFEGPSIVEAKPGIAHVSIDFR